MGVIDSRKECAGERGNPLAVALAVSLALHLAGIYGLSTEPPREAATRGAVFQARLASHSVPPPKPGAASLRPAVAIKPLSRPSRTATKKKTDTESRPETLLVPELPAPDPVYYPAKQWDVPPALLEPVHPVYPDAARANNIRGEVLLLLQVDEFGQVRESTVMESNPPGYFELSAVEAYAGARFSPAKINGRDVKSRFLVRFRY